jgi:manganese transport protein
VVANDPEYMGEQVNGAVTNAAGVFYLIVILVASLAAVPLLIITGAGS